MRREILLMAEASRTAAWIGGVAKGAVLGLALAAVTCRPAVDRDKFQPLYRAAKSVEVLTGLDPSFEALSSAVQELATEASVTADQLETPEERALLERYREVLQAYQDSLRLWSAETAGGDLLVATRPSAVDAPAPETTTELAPLVGRYDLPTTTVPEDAETLLEALRRTAAKDPRLDKLWLKSVFMTLEELRQAVKAAGVAFHEGHARRLAPGSYRTVWGAASRRLAAANAAFYGRPERPAPGP